MIYLAAGTSSGCVFVWKFSYNELVEVLKAGSGSEGQSGYYIVDDGKKLHSLLQSSEHSIIQVSLSSAFDPEALSKIDTDTDIHTLLNKAQRSGHGSASSLVQRVLLSTADTQAYVRTHCETDTINESLQAQVRLATHSVAGLVSKSIPGTLAIPFELERSAVASAINSLGGGPVTFCGESHFDNPVVTCNFRDGISPVTFLSSRCSQ